MAGSRPGERTSRGGGSVYVKLYPSLWDGSLASDTFDTWALFLFLLAHADPEGFVEMTPEAISRRSGIPLDLVTAGLERLKAPDPRSRSREHEGRRLEPIDDRGWGWRIVNYLHYRTLRTEAERRERNREKQARRRARRLEAGAPAVVVHGHAKRRTPGVAPCTPGVAPAYPQAEAEGDADGDAEKKARVPPQAAPHPAAGYRRGLIEELQARHPTRDVPEIAAKLAERHAKKPYKDIDIALRNWVRTAEQKDIDRRHTPPPASTGAGVLARIEAERQQSLRDHDADPEAAARTKADVERLVDGAANALAMERRGRA